MIPKTKEEIIKEHYPCTCSIVYTSREMPDPNCTYHEELYEMELMMDEYAQQEAIGFAEWITRNSYQGIDTSDEGVIWNIPGNAICETTVELYTLYQLQLPNQQSPQQ